MKTFTAMSVAILVFCLSIGCNGLRGQTPQDCYEKGRQNYAGGNRGLAYKYLAKAAHDEPENVKYQWAAACAAPNPKFALYHVKTAWDNGLRNREIFDVYRNLSGITDTIHNQEFVFQLYRQLPDSIRTEDLRAEIFFSFKQYDSTLAILQDLFNRKPSPKLVCSIAKTYLAKGDNEKAKVFLLESRTSKLLNMEGYLLLNLAYLHDFDFAGCASVFDAAKTDGFYNDELKSIQARGLVAQGKYDEAEPLLQQLKISETAKNPDFKMNTLSMLSFIYFNKGDKKALLGLEEGLQGDTGNVKLEKMYLNAITGRLSDTASLVPVLVDLLKKFPAYPEIQIILAQELARSGKNSDALKVFQNLPDVYLGSPRIVVERARLFDLTGRSSDALAMLSMLHSRKIASKASLELFRDISYKKNSIDDATKAQKLLEKVYKNDVGVRWAKGVMHLRNGNYDSAITVFSALMIDFPKENRFFYARLNAYFDKGNYEKVLQECSIHPSSELPVLRLQARAFAKKGMPVSADSVYRIAVEANKKDVGIGLEYAEFLLHSNNPVKAAEIYRGLIDKKTGALGSDTGKATAIALNNLAWALLQTDGADKETVLSAIKRAYAIDKGNSSIVDTYAEALLRFKRFDECIGLLENSDAVKNNGELLLRLADAYEKSGKSNKTVRTLQEAEKQFDADPVKKETIHKRIAAIIARN